MNAKGDANRSVRMTKQRLYQALITLLQQKSLREITVRELTELAGISRGTFYFHYTDIYALMDQMEAAQLKRLNELMDTLIPSISQEDVPTALVALFTYLTENPDLCAALYGKSWESEFTASVKRLIAERCWGNFAPPAGPRIRNICFPLRSTAALARLRPGRKISSSRRRLRLRALPGRRYAP